MSIIIPGGPGDPRRQAASNPYTGEAHGLSASQIERMNERFEGMLPQIVTSSPDYQRSKLLEDDFRRIGATSSPFRKRGQVVPGATPSGPNMMVSGQIPYQPEFSSPDRQSYPVHRILANRYWRLFHKLDPVVGNCLDMYSEMPWSNFQLRGEGVDGEVKDHFERMTEKVNLLAILPFMVREFNVVGEAIPHLLYDGASRMWDYCTLHNPDNIEVIDAPFIRMDPIVELIPDQRLRALLSSGDPLIQKIKAQLPPELLGRLLSRQNLPLDPLNCTFLPRKLHPYDVRGTSIISRLWRVLMLEDSIFSATIATARRHAGPLRVAKLGNPQSGWIPGPEHEQRLLELLAQAELDPLAWICFVEGTPVTMVDGTEKPIEQVQVGNEVLDMHGMPQKVERAWCEGTPSEVTEINLGGCDVILATHQHRWPAWVWPRKCACGCGSELSKPGQVARKGHLSYTGLEVGYEDAPDGRRIPANWDPVQTRTSAELLPGDFLVVPTAFKERIPDGVTAAHARLLGYYVAEGHVSENYLDYGTRPSGKIRTAVWSFDIAEQDTWARDVVDLCAELGMPARIDLREKSANAILQHEEHAHFAQWLATHGGRDCLQKRLSRDVMDWPLALKAEFIRGAFRGDGSQYLNFSNTGVNGAPQILVQYATSSEALVTQVRLILIQLGVVGAIRQVSRKDCFEHHALLTRPEPGKPGVCAQGHSRAVEYTVQVSGEYARRLADLVWEGGSFSEQGRAKHRTRRPFFPCDGEHVYVPIKSVRAVPNDKPVYNLTVSGSHTYRVGRSSVSTKNCYHYGVTFEAFGVTDRVISVGREWETLERIKLVGLGVSKSFLHGEVSYASSITGLQVFLQRLLALRGYFESKWILPKFYRPIAEINDFIKPTKAELSHRVRVRRTAQELDDDSRYIVPTIDWDKKLDPYVDRDLIGAFELLERIGVKISKKTKLAAVGLKHEDEMHSSLQEEILEAKERQKFEKELGPAGQGPTGMQPSQQPQPGQPPPGMGQPGGPPAIQPPPRPGTQPPQLPAGQAPQQPQPQAQQAAQPASDGVLRRPMPRTPPPEESIESPQRRGNWTPEEIDAVKELFRTGRSDEAFWAQAATDRFKGAIGRDDYEEAWADIELYLEAQGYPDEDVGSLRRILVLEDILQPESEDYVKDVYDALPEHGLGPDAEAEDAFMRAFRGGKAKGNGHGMWSGSASLSTFVGEGNVPAAPGGGGSKNPFRRRST